MRYAPVCAMRALIASTWNQSIALLYIATPLYPWLSRKPQLLFARSNIIAPTISLNSGNIVYDYYLNLDGILGTASSSLSSDKVNSSVRAHIDPTKGIILKWTDGIQGSGGGNGRAWGSCWVTECQIPLSTVGAPTPSASTALAAKYPAHNNQQHVYLGNNIISSSRILRQILSAQASV